MASIRGMFRFATPLDYFLMTIGSLCAMANGAGLAGFSIILGDIFDALNSPESGKAESLAVLFVWIGLGVFTAATVQVGAWMVVSERLTIKLRQRYLEALLAQEISFFDSSDSGALTARLAENAIKYRESLGEKFAALFQYLA